MLTYFQAASGGLFIGCEEEKSNDRFEHAWVFFYGGSVPAAFLAEHAPGLEVRDGTFDSDPDFAQRGVELGLAGGEVASGRSFERDEFDTFDPDIAQIGHRRQIGEQSFQVALRCFQWVTQRDDM
jgi:hypothetical protein